MARDRRRRKGRGRRTLIGLVIVLALLWCGYWLAVRYIAGVAVERAEAAMSARGSTITCTDGGFSGFPLALDIRCTEGKLAGAASSGGLGLVSVSAPLYDPGHVQASLSGPLTFAAPGGGTVTAAWKHASGAVDLWIDGLRSLNGALQDLRIEASGRTDVDSLAIANAVLSLGPAGDDFHIAASLDRLAVERPGTAFPPLSVEIDLTAVKFGRAFGPDVSKTLADWVAKGGALKVTKLAFVAGETNLALAGDLTLAPTGLFSGKLRLKATSLERLAQFAETLRPGSGKEVERVAKGVAAFMKPAKDGSPARELDLIVSNGAVIAGMLPLPIEIPKLEF